LPWQAGRLAGWQAGRLAGNRINPACLSQSYGIEMNNIIYIML
jgi:hypothetical protein